VFYFFYFVFGFHLGELNAAELLIVRPRQDAPRRRLLERGKDVCRVLGDVQTGGFRVLLVYLDRVDLAAVQRLPHAVDVAQVIEPAQLNRRTRRRRWRWRRAHLHPAVALRGSGGLGRRIRHEVHAQDADLAHRGDLTGQRRLRHNRDVATLLGGQHVPLG